MSARLSVYKKQAFLNKRAMELIGRDTFSIKNSRVVEGDKYQISKLADGRGNIKSLKNLKVELGEGTYILNGRKLIKL